MTVRASSDSAPAGRLLPRWVTHNTARSPGRAAPRDLADPSPLRQSIAHPELYTELHSRRGLDEDIRRQCRPRDDERVVPETRGPGGDELQRIAEDVAEAHPGAGP